MAKEENLARINSLEAYGKSIEKILLIITSKRAELTNEVNRLSRVIIYHNDSLKSLRRKLESIRMYKETREDELARADRMEAQSKSIKEDIEVILNKRASLVCETDSLSRAITYHIASLQFLKHEIDSIRNG